MSIGNLKHEDDLRRWLQQQLQTPGILPQTPQGGVALVKEGTPEDGDFPGTPGDGLLALDKSTKPPTLYARVNNEWVAV